jgi:hypothetical protein
MGFALLVSGCGGDGDSRPGPVVSRPSPVGEPRSVMLGFGVIPSERTSEAYRQAFATTARYGEIVRIQRAPPWEDFLPGGQISKETRETTELETALLDQYSNLKRFYAIDPTDAALRRGRLVNLPAGIDPEVGFESGPLRAAFLAYVAYIAKNYKPDYLAIGVEVNMLAERSRAQFEAFVSLYREAYTLAKETSPATKVFPTFQLEAIEGVLDLVHSPDWAALEPFRGAMDVLAVSSYPYLGDVGLAGAIREAYYTQLTTRFSGEVIIAETAYPSAPVEGKGVSGTPEDQAAFLGRLLDDAEESGIAAVIWLTALDPAFATEGNAAVFRDVGLRKSDGANKLAWEIWEEWASRPLK